MFWGLVLEPAKKYTQRVEQSFHISQAALELKSADLEPVQIVLEWEGSSFILATLSKKNSVFQVPLDLNFETGDQISFRTIGKGRVHLSGYHIMDDDDLGGLMQEEEEESDVEEETGTQNAIQTSGKRKKALNKTNESKKQKFDTTNEEEDEDEDSEDSDDSDEDLTAGDTTGFDNTTMGDSTMFDMYDEDDDDEEDSDELEEESEDEDDDEEDEEDESEEEEADPAPKSDKKKQNQSVNASVNGISSSKKDKKNKVKSEGSPAKENATPKKDKLSPKKEVKTPKQGDSQKKTPKSENKTLKQDGKSPKTPGTPGTKKVLEGGVIIEELQFGEGQVIKPGKMAQVYYSGRLKSNNKLFDSATQGPGFKFRLGKGEVIKGWDIGVNGMKIGGKRRITIPSHLAYGAKGSPPAIPPNATLVFEVELKGIS